MLYFVKILSYLDLDAREKFLFFHTNIYLKLVIISNVKLYFAEDNSKFLIYN